MLRSCLVRIGLLICPVELAPGGYLGIGRQQAMALQADYPGHRCCATALFEDGWVKKMRGELDRLGVE